MTSRPATTQNVFQSTPPARGATVYNDDVVPHMEISIHAPREGGDSTYRVGITQDYISIHAPREGGDALANFIGGVVSISIHAPREGGD